MSTVITHEFPAEWSVADMIAHLGDIPGSRIRMVPLPGTATEQDVLEAKARYGRICELIDGTLVEKTMGWKESVIAGEILRRIGNHLVLHNLGQVTAGDGMLRILPAQVRVPDVAFVAWHRFPGGRPPSQQIPPTAPDLAVEVLSPSNTEAEMRRKLRDYFAAGSRLVWYIDPASRLARVYTSPEQCTLVGEDGVLSGGDVLPGFTLSLGELFAWAEQGRRE